MDADQEVDVFLEHFGVKGMRWGHRNPAKRLDRLNANTAVLGYGIRGYAAGKVNKQYVKKNKLDKFEIKDYSKLSEDLRNKYDSKIKRRAYFSVIGRGVVEAALVKGAAHLAVKNLNFDKQAKDLIKEGSTVMAAMVGITRGIQVKAIHTSYTLDDLRKEVHGN